MRNEDFGVQSTTTLKKQDANTMKRPKGQATPWVELCSYALIAQGRAMSGAEFGSSTIEKKRGSYRLIPYVFGDFDSCFEHNQSYEDHPNVIMLLSWLLQRQSSVSLFHAC